MNYTNLSLANVPDTFTETFFANFRFVNCSICIVGTVAQLINISVLTLPTFKDSSYKYIQINSINNMLYLLFVGLFNFYWCGFNCKIENKSLFFVIYYLAIDEYLTSCMAMFNLFIQIFLSIQRIFLVTNKKFLHNIAVWKVVLIIAILSLTFYIPVLVVQKIVKTENNKNTTISQSYDENMYSVVSTEFGLSSAGTTFKTLLKVGRISTATIIFTIVNTINYVSFRRFFNKRSKLLKLNKFTNLSK